MRRPASLLVCACFALGCRRSPSPSETPPPASASAAPSASATVSADPSALLTAWNQAHNAHDAAALEKLYAAKVLFYGAEMTGARAAAQKRAAFAASPSYAQAILKTTFEKTPDGGETWARFDKVDRTKKKTFPMLVRFDASGHVVEESDDVTRDENWCFVGEAGEKGPSDVVLAPFRLSAQSAVAAAMASRHFRALQKDHPGALVGSHGLTFGFTCAKRCAAPKRPTMLPGDGDDCNFSFRVDDVNAVTESNLLDWLEVDPITKTLYWEDFGGDAGGRIESEALP